MRPYPGRLQSNPQTHLEPLHLDQYLLERPDLDQNLLEHPDRDQYLLEHPDRDQYLLERPDLDQFPRMVITKGVVLVLVMVMAVVVVVDGARGRRLGTMFERPRVYEATAPKIYNWGFLIAM
ncbi:hypothetical protein GWK47_034176 [Chionoecetes opilio]|uniref:Uncharacterized protein n=1 Tax=Chionoecetes opilio TaxID=41210 RepID=A0A8J5D3Q3_CHIOP|nr:hypothetical protein GWK47_034176 [Chionoecetes opilio]